MSTNKTAESLANLTFNMIPKCQAKEDWLAEERGLFQAELKCLRLFGSEKSLNNKEIAKRMNLSQSRLTRIIDGLVQKGYLNREIDQTDRRNIKVTLSRRGKIFTNKLDKAFMEIHTEILKDMNVSQQKDLITTMQHLLTASEKWLQKPE